MFAIEYLLAEIHAPNPCLETQNLMQEIFIFVFYQAAVGCNFPFKYTQENISDNNTEQWHKWVHTFLDTMTVSDGEECDR